MRTKIAVVVSSLGLLSIAVPAPAHHAFAAEFNASKPVLIEGTITRVRWINPHAWFDIEVKRPDGTVEHWMIEGGTPSTLARRGIRRDVLPVGTAVVVKGFQANDGTNKANGQELRFADGRSLFMGSEGTGAPDPLKPPKGSRKR